MSSALVEDKIIVDINQSHTCYNGEHTKKHDWGYGCDHCPACELRKNGWQEYISNF